MKILMNLKNSKNGRMKIISEKYNIAEKKLIDLGITTPNDINLEIIAWSQNVKVNRRPLEKCEAWIIGDKDGAIVSVNSCSSPERQRFSIAHELGHWELDRGDKFICTSNDMDLGFQNSQTKELRANRFAADLIFPNYLFKPYTKRVTELTWSVVKELASIFNTSLTATAIRLIESNEFPSIFTIYKNERRSFFWRSPQLSKLWFPKEEVDFSRKKLVKDDNMHPVSADFWFDIENGDELEIYEQLFPLSDEETVFSLLTIKDPEIRELDLDF